MSPSGGRNLLTVLAVLAAVVIAALALLGPFRALETNVAAGVARAAGVAVEHVDGSAVEISPAQGPTFRAVLSPPSSVLPSLLVIAALGALLPFPSWPRRATAALVALGAVSVFHLARLAGAMGIGALVGTEARVLFHPWVGAGFAFLYTLGGFLILLAWLLGSRPAAPAAGA
jgi:hypothetical protein